MMEKFTFLIMVHEEVIQLVLLNFLKTMDGKILLGEGQNTVEKN